MHLKGYQVWISCDGRPLPEYKVERKGDDAKTITCYIPSESGKTFGIVWRDHVNQSHLRFVTKVDGRAAGGNRCRPGGKGTRWGVRTSTTTRQPFQFAPLQTTDDEAHMHTLASAAALGEIEVSVIRIRAEYRAVPHTMGKFQPVEAVHERSKKAGVHCVSLGANRQVPLSRTQTSSTPLDPREGPVAKFIFRYRPKGLLQAQGIIPTQVADRKPTRLDRPLKRRLSDDGEELGDRPSQRAKRARHVYNIDEEDVKPHIFKIDLSEDEDVKPVVVKTEVSDDDEEEEEVVEAVIVKDELSDDDEEDAEEEEDLEVLQSQIQQLQERYERASRRKSLSASQSQSQPRGVKEEEPGPATQLGAVVIDLTLDDD